MAILNSRVDSEEKKIDRNGKKGQIFFVSDLNGLHSELFSANASSKSQVRFSFCNEMTVLQIFFCCF